MALDEGTTDSLFALYRQRDFGELAVRVRTLLETHADELVLHSLLGAACLELEDHDGAIASYERALELRPGFAKAHNGLGLVHLRQGRAAAALECFSAAVRHAPGLAPAHFNLGIVLEHARRWHEAAEHYAQAARCDPRHVDARTACGLAAWELGQLDGVLAHFDAALAIRPDHVPAHRGRLAFLEQANRHDELRAALTRARAALGEHALVALYDGIVAELEQDLARARTLLESIRFDVADARSMHDERQRLARLARLADKLDDPDAAIAYAADANELSARIDADSRIDKRTFLDFVANRRRLFTSDERLRRRAAGLPAADPAPIFIVGFPRSGTTLLDTLLRGHPDVDVVEEADAVASLVAEHAGPSDERLAALGELSAAALGRLRTTYSQALSRHAGAGGRAHRIDRFGLNMIYAGEIHRVFPEARFVLLLRHPADCVLSCYMQSFRASSANASFHTLEDAAHLYDRVFDLWTCYTEALDLDVYTLRYEDLVTDVEAGCRALLAHLGIEWHAGMLAHEATARARPLIRTASYRQVVRPVTSEAVDRWRRYRDALEPALRVLAPWIERLGYST